MNAAITVEQFNALLQSEQDESLLLKVLRQLTRLEQPEKVRVLKDEAEVWWQGWNS